ncbi:right-handed parallel beta-helix repeat-containing protein [Pedobacter insulae]|uniref:Right handed beta helix region n=1 Tax=Pedobacter insulae TaxID=414048 RepID=A0A1I2WF49_9SPHI|nr:right-handed parallel beta-helix repeat-containing protein [Pedobacter insulae]SFG99935.1 Right handed beta helix region [Pedobacter insulae]
MKVISVVIWSALSLAIMLAFNAPGNKGKSKTYYVNATTGNDENSGSSPTNAWKTLTKINAQVFQPGDIIRLKCNEFWEGQLVLQGSGTPNRPITLSSYGKGKKPIIDGKGKVDQIILLKNIEGWHIDNLELTNKAASVGNRTGILVTSLANELKQHFRFTNLYIHDIMGDYSFETKGKNTGGIGLIGGENTKFNDIIIENCEIGNINRVGIFTNLTKGNNAKRGNRPFTKLIIRNNKIHHCAGDGAIIRYAFQPIISHNLAYENHNGPENLVKHGVALWCRSTDEARFEYNEVHHTRGGMDGQAFDADLDSYRTVVQYNYSHDNEGGFMLVYGSSSESIVRYNLSVNDGVKGKHIFDFPVWTKPRGSGIFHNNTVVLPKDAAVVVADEALPTSVFYNNIFYQQGDGTLVTESEGETAQFINNAYYGFAKPSQIGDTAAILDKNLFIKTTNGIKVKSIGVDVKEVAKNYWLSPSEVNFKGKRIGVKNWGVGAFH